MRSTSPAVHAQLAPFKGNEVLIDHFDNICVDLIIFEERLRQNLSNLGMLRTRLNCFQGSFTY